MQQIGNKLGVVGYSSRLTSRYFSCASLRFMCKYYRFSPGSKLVVIASVDFFLATGIDI